MGTLTADCPRLDDHCPHKLATSCRLTSTPKCCACADERAHSRTYRVYIDGIGFVQRGKRWQGYCWFCKEFWTNRLAATDPPLEASQTRIPEIPDQTEFLERWFEFHQGYRIVTLPDGTEQRISVIGEPFKEVSPGFLPRTLDQVIQGCQNDAMRPENRLRRRQLTSEGEQLEEVQQDLDSALDSLLAEAENEETPQPDVSTPDPRVHLVPLQQQSSTAESPQPAHGPRRPNRGETRLRRTQDGFVRLFGTPEAIQHADYESPLSTMYNRAESLYHQAEERRATNITSPSPSDVQSAYVPGAIEGGMLLSLLRLMRASRLTTEGELEDSVSSHASRQLRPTELLQSIESQAMRISRVEQAARDSRLPSQPPTSLMTFGEFLESRAASSSSSSSPATTRPSRSGPAIPSHPTHINRRESFLRFADELLQPMDEAVRARNRFLSMAVSELQRDDAEPSSSSAARPSSEDINANGNDMPRYDLEEESTTQQVAEYYRLAFASHPIASARQRPSQTLDNQAGRPDAMSEEEMTKKLDCQVCYQQLADIALLPCGHMIMCQWCADVVVPVKHSHIPILPTKCPMCRKSVKQRFRIRM